MILIPENSFIVFDLDDTLYKEEDFLLSAYNHIACMLEDELGDNIFDEMSNWYLSGESTFDKIEEKYRPKMNIKEMVYEYRNHFPKISLSPDTEELLQGLKDAGIPLGLITDGRSISQRNKLKALGIESIFEHLVISEEIGAEKPSEQNFIVFEDRFPNKHFYYIADNTAKDFITPNKLGWTTICLLDNGRNIHKQNLQLGIEYLPTNICNSLREIENSKF